MNLTLFSQLVKLVADVLYKSPANNDFIFMVEHKMMDDGIANLIEGMSPKFAQPGACAEFQVGTLSINSKIIPGHFSRNFSTTI